MKAFALLDQWRDPATHEARQPITSRADSFDTADRALERARLHREGHDPAAKYGLVSEIVVVDTETGRLVYDERIAPRP